VDTQTPNLTDRLALTLLRQYFGYTHFRPGQDEVIRSIAHYNDTFVVMPTGGGKSLCYQIPALMLDGTALVISPLIALMQDQVRGLEKAGIPACFINSSLQPDEIRRRMNAAREGAYKLVYVAPERLESKQFLEQMQLVQWSFMAVDEAHCVSEWGHDFRPAYLTLALANEALGGLPVIALTATATPEVQDDITTQLKMRSVQRFIRGFDRPNLTYTVEHDHEKTARVADICAESQSTGTTIVYCGSRKRVEQFTRSLRQVQIFAEPYHGGLTDSYRRAVLERFLTGECKTIIATNAFGMGVDKPDVRNVVHCDMTLSLEAYYQEAGRAGRDGLPARCTMLYAQGDRRLMEFFLQCTYPAPETVETIYTLLYDRAQVGRGQRATEPLQMDDAQIATAAKVHAGEASAVIALLERAGVMRRGSPGNTGRVQFLVPRERMREYYGNVPERRRNALNALARLAGSAAFYEPVEFDVMDVWRKHGIQTDEFLEAMRSFEYARLVHFEPPGMTKGITLLEERLPREHLRTALPLDWHKITLRRERAAQKLDAVEHYAQTTECKRNVLLGYFGDDETDADGVSTGFSTGFSTRCGRCSSCTQAERAAETARTMSPRRAFLLEQTLQAAAELDARFGRTVLTDVLQGDKTAEMVRKYGLMKAQTFGTAREFSRQEILECVQTALAAQFLAVSDDRFPKISLTPRGAAELKTIPEPFRTDGYNRDDCSFPELLETAKRIRTEIATMHRVLPPVVVDDRSLVVLVNALPHSVSAMRREVRNLSDLCTMRFAPLFLAAVRDFMSERAATTGDDMCTLAETVRRTVELLRAGEVPETVADKRGVNVRTVGQHIEVALEEGVHLERERFVQPPLYDAVQQILAVRPEAFLKDIKMLLPAELSGAEWWELRVAAAFVRTERRERSLRL
jgi:ATP-dependent DNA helicase RecQ